MAEEWPLSCFDKSKPVNQGSNNSVTKVFNSSSFQSLAIYTMRLESTWILSFLLSFSHTHVKSRGPTDLFFIFSSKKKSYLYLFIPHLYRFPVLTALLTCYVTLSEMLPSISSSICNILSTLWANSHFSSLLRGRNLCSLTHVQLVNYSFIVVGLFLLKRYSLVIGIGYFTSNGHQPTTFGHNCTDPKYLRHNVFK